MKNIRAYARNGVRVIQTEKLLLTVAEAGEQLGIGRSHLYRLIENREIESISIGRSRRIPAQALQAFIERLRSEQWTLRGSRQTQEI